jgi:hypothetical protein
MGPVMEEGSQVTGKKSEIGIQKPEREPRSAHSANCHRRMFRSFLRELCALRVRFFVLNAKRGYSHPFSLATRAASIRFDAPNLSIASDR